MTAHTLGLQEIRASAFGQFAATIGDTLLRVGRGISDAKELRDAASGAHDGEDGSYEHLRELALEFARIQRS